MKKFYWLLLLLFIPLIFACSGNKQTKSVLPLEQTSAKNSKSKKDNKTETPPEVLLKNANELLAKGRCADALNAYNQFLAKMPNDAGGYNLLGLAYVCERKFEPAIEAFQKALQILPTYTDVHNNLGVAYMEMKNYPEARKEFLIALQDPNYAKGGPYFNLGKLAFSQQSYEESRALAKKAMELVPKQRDGLPQLADTGPLLLYSLSLERLNRYDEAEASFRDLLKVDSQNAEAAFSLGNIMVHKNQPCLARQYYLQVVDADPLSELGQKAIETLKTIHCEQ
jgi:type IV pilus assembly protein PilF